MEWTASLDRPHPEITPSGPTYILCADLQEANSVFSLQEAGEWRGEKGGRGGTGEWGKGEGREGGGGGG